MLVRDEYRTALQTLETDALYEEGAYVTGQPGIGKSLFLVYLLVELLGRCQKVAVHCPDMGGYAIFTDTVAFYPLTNTLPLRSGDRIWALSDSRGSHKTVPHCFYSNLRYTLPIQTTSLRKERWHDWSKEAGAECYIMDIWTEQEIANLALLLELNGGRMVSLHKRWGGSIRLLLSYLEKSDQQIEMGYTLDAALPIKECWSIMTSIAGKDLPEDAPSQFFFCRPFDFAMPCIERSFTCAVVPTPTICHFLAEALQKLNCSTRSKLFHTLSQYRETRQAARYIFETWFHCFFSAGNSIDCHWLQCQSTVSPLRGTTTLIAARSNELRAVANLPYYWVAPPKFPGIDSALIRQDAIFALTTRSKDESLGKGLEQLQNDLPSHLRNLPWHLVFVGNPHSSVEVAAKEWASKTCVSVAWSKVDPVREDITYRIIREKDSNEWMEVEDDEY
ncbi:hypothetical protein L210DRAFT_3537693 [Boletus edulis BED1]|uniref:Uncharacterized protein n=1 Tax=Boletus edulis BED1 TaxID=1328754 RepID=A0AAD4BWJ7_BOLED|nr:hypothetical protein L210DRAFT_3537693 [Boletus edulis BED1]